MRPIYFLCTLCCLLGVCILKSLQSPSHVLLETEQVYANKVALPAIHNTINNIQPLCCIVDKSNGYDPFYEASFICTHMKLRKLRNSYVDSIVFPETGNLFQSRCSGISQELLLFRDMCQFAIHQVMAAFSQQYKSKLYAVIPLPVFRTYRLNKDVCKTTPARQDTLTTNTFGNILSNIRDTLDEDHANLYDVAPHFRKDRHATC